MKSLIIAEKNTLAKTIVDALKLLGENFTNVKKSNSFYYESEKYIVCCARGHLFTLFDIDDYLGIKSNWSLDQLPFFPKTFKWKPIDDAIEYVKNIKFLLIRNDIDTVINAGDSAREGEFLIRLILQELKNNRPVKRLWMPTQVAEDIKKNILEMKDDSEYDNLFNEGLARSLADWIEGINLSRYVTLRAGSFCRVGRVSTAIVRAIYERDNEIKNFKPEKYYKLVSNVDFLGNKLRLESSFEFEEDELKEAERLAKIINNSSTVVSDISKNDKVIKVGKPFSQSKLQNYLSEKYKFSPDETLKIAQSLYEKKFITYPRTDTEYLEPGRFESLSRVIGRFCKEGYKVKIDPNDKIFDISKISDHGAIVPTIIFPKEGELNEKEQIGYDAIKNRFLAYFCTEPYIIENTNVTLKIGDIDEIEISSHVVKNPGWTSYETNDKKDNFLQPLAIGQTIPVNFKVVECFTNPKKHYTVSTLNNYLENPLKTIKGNSEEAELEAYKNLLDGCTIGTASSIAGIIEKIRKDNLISLTGKTYTIMPKGEFLIETLNKLDIHIDEKKTIDMNKYLKQIFLGNKTVEEYIQIVKKDIKLILDKSSAIEVEEFKNNGNIMGKCPRCKDNVNEYDKIYACSNSNCKFKLFKDDLFWTSKQKQLTSSMVKKFLEGKTVKLTKIYSEKKNKFYDAEILMEDDGFNTRFTIIFDKPKRKNNKNKKAIQYM